MRVMKDKLVKTGHKGAYYRLRKFSLGSLVVITLGLAVAIPTYLSNIKMAEQETSAQKNNENEPEENLESEEIEVEHYED